MVKRASALLPMVAFLSGCCLEVVDGQGGISITGETSGGISGATTGGTTGVPPCPEAGSCASDSDCVVAYCASAPCGGCNHFAVAKALLSENVCLAEVGPVDGPTSSAPAACQVSPERCGCPAHPHCGPRCLSGACACVDAGF